MSQTITSQKVSTYLLNYLKRSFETALISCREKTWYGTSLSGERKHQDMSGQKILCGYATMLP